MWPSRASPPTGSIRSKGPIADRDEKVFSWLHQFVESHNDLPDNRQFMDSVKLDLFHDVVYVFTPKGLVKELPRGSTPVDFAFAIHTEIGNRCVGAKVNGKIVPLRYAVQSGDAVEILTSPTQTPNKDWLKFVRTSRAKTKIKHWIKLEEQARSVDIGRRLLEVELRKHHLHPAQALKSDEMLAVAKASGYDGVEELIAAVGYGKLASAQIVARLLPQGEQQVVPHESSTTPKPPATKPDDRGVKVRGARDLLMQLSRCCNPVPGDRILGYITRGRGLTIHAVGCPNLEALDYDKERLVEVEWDQADSGTHDVKISVIAVDRTGVLANVSSSIAECNANINRAEIATREDRKAILDFVVEVSDTRHLNKVLEAVERVDGVVSARRVRTWQTR